MKVWSRCDAHLLKNLRIAALITGFLICLLATNQASHGQSGAGSIQGTVTDATGAVVPGVAIRVVNRATSMATDTVSNGVGFYQVPALFTGTYDLTVTAPGFKVYQTAIQLLVAQQAVINAALTPGDVTQRIEVAADLVQLTTTESGTIGSTLEAERINQLPMNGRVLLGLVGATTPGLEASGTRANGLMGEAMEYVADGVSLQNRQFGGAQMGSTTLSQLPDPDAVQEVRVETVNTSAQYAEPGTAIITTKSGTNALHGTMFETARNNAIGIAKARENATNYAAPHLVRNEWGISGGGPIKIPKLYSGKDRSFWFFAWERYSQSKAASEWVTVPTLAMRGGDFSNLKNSSGTLLKLYDPSTTQSAANKWARTQFPGNIIPASLISPTAKIIYDITPKPSTDDNPLVTHNLSTINPVFSVVPTVTFRLDHAFNENNRSYLRYTNNLLSSSQLRNYPSNSPATVAADGFPAAASGMTITPSATFAGAVGFTHVFSPTFFSETIISQQWFSQHIFAGGTPLANFETKLGLPNNFGQVGFPNFGSNLICPLGGTQFVYSLSQIVSNLDENMTKTIGRHQLQFGGRYRREQFGNRPDQSADSVTFGGYATWLLDPLSGSSYTATSYTGHQDADMFLGAAASYQIYLQPQYERYHDMESDLYIQDNFHLSRNLTLNVGLRYESHPAVSLANDLMESFDFKNSALVFPHPIADYIAKGYTTQAIVTNMQNLGVKFETAQEAGLPSPKLLRDYNLNFAPRVGFAYSLFGGKHGTVLRGAYGRYIYPEPTRNYIKNIQQNAPYTATYSRSYVSSSQSPDGLANYLLRSPQTVVMGTNSSNVVDSSSVNAMQPGVWMNNINPNFPPDFVAQTNLTVEQAFKGNSALRVTWVWVHGTNLDQVYDYNYAPSTYVWEMQTGTTPPTGSLSSVATLPFNKTWVGSGSIWEQKTGWSNDNALQVNYQRLFHRGIAYQISYVWSKPMRLGGNTSRDGVIYPAQDYVGATGNLGTMVPVGGTAISPSLPPSRPAGTASWESWHALDAFQNYKLDTAIPKHHISFNGIVDLPVGRGKRFLGNANRFVNELVGGFQIAGAGSITTQVFQPNTANWGPTSTLKTYKHGAPITDCRSGVCRKTFEWYNGYIAPSVINASSLGVTGLPSDYVPFQSPINSTANTNQATVTLLNGQTQVQTYSPGPSAVNPFAKTFLNGPTNWSIDLSAFKVFPITERVNIRFNVDAFNALNMQGYINPDVTTGIQSLLTSYNTPRQIQLTLRLTF